MAAPTVIELPDGKKLYFGGDAKKGLSEVSAKGKIATVTTEKFKSLGFARRTGQNPGGVDRGFAETAR